MKDAIVLGKGAKLEEKVEGISVASALTKNAKKKKSVM